jgi:hypothetical protein
MLSQIAIGTLTVGAFIYGCLWFFYEPEMEGLHQTNVEEASNPWAAKNEKFFRSFMDRSSYGWGPCIYETCAPRLYKDYPQCDPAMEGIIREAKSLANKAFDGTGGKVSHFSVSQEGLSYSEVASFFHDYSGFEPEQPEEPRLYFELTVQNYGDDENYDREKTINFKSEWKTVNEWTHHQPRLLESGESDTDLMFETMKPKEDSLLKRLRVSLGC